VYVCMCGFYSLASVNASGGKRSGNASYKGCDAYLRSMSMCEHEGEKQRKIMAVLRFSVITGSGLPSNHTGDGIPFDLL
ncbi:hypothetical protein, partial [Pseudomonas syringae group genomosp. 7]|uniref:hypothetical protein n=1 Tax=Pseudomonas syringae group genomosp. 7 TaxID=251699 RepID=UPI00376F9B89